MLHGASGLSKELVKVPSTISVELLIYNVIVEVCAYVLH